MNLAIDVGNTAIKMGYFSDDKLEYYFSFYTDAKMTADEIASKIIHLKASKNLSHLDVDKIMVSSVVPSINNALADAIMSIYHAPITFIAPGVKNGLILKVDHPNEIGADLICDLVAGKEKYGYPLAIIDFGTATKILVLDQNGAFVSCVIFPGVATSALTLKKTTSLLKEIVINDPKPLLKVKQTDDAINAGIIYSQAGGIESIIDRYEKELGYHLKRVITGGPAPIFTKIFDQNYIFDEHLTLLGANLISQKQK